MSAPESLYLNDLECLVYVFDLRQPCAAEGIHRQRVSWGEDSDIEALDGNHFTLIVQQGRASEPAA